MRSGPAAFAVALTVAAIAAGAAVAATFSDPVGDTTVRPLGADVTGVIPPDITLVEVTNTPGVLTFRITLATPTISPSSAIGVVLDLDKNPSTGDSGVEAVIDHAFGFPTIPDQVVFQRWNGTRLEVVPSTSVTASFSAGVVTITALRTELMNTRGLGVGAVAISASGAAAITDIAPDNEEFFVYDLVGLPPPPPPRLSASRAIGAPARPRTGKPFVVSSSVTRDDTGAVVTSGRVTCAVRVDGARIHAKGRFAVRRARCAMRAPATSRGKTLRGSLTVRSAGARVTRTFAFRVV